MEKNANYFQNYFENRNLRDHLMYRTGLLKISITRCFVKSNMGERYQDF